ncbi:uncharacterized protein At5g49945-like [Aristolochia californica]|uniref:uncharacterized protein At5g49945-like n=1 Tax=Aristolochia californica TaxID=171875 RepID=UPI0035E16945
MANVRWCSRLCHLLTHGETLWYCLAVVSVISLLGQELSRCSVLAADFEGFGDEADGDLPSDSDHANDLPYVAPVPPPRITQSDFETDRGPPEQPLHADPTPKPSSPPATATFEYWNEDEFEGLPTELAPQNPTDHEIVAGPPASEAAVKPSVKPQLGPRSYTVEIVCISFLIAFVFNYFTGKRENENIAIAWATQFATKDSIFEKNFSLLGTEDGQDTPLLLKEGQNVFKFYASGRRFCQGLLATMELKSRHDLISRIYNAIIPCKDEITFEVYMNDDVVIAFPLFHRVTHCSGEPPRFKASGIASQCYCLAPSDQVVIQIWILQVFGDKAFEKYGKGFISLHVSDQHAGSHKKMLLFKFALPSANNMANMTRLVALVPYYIDLVGRYKLSQQARSKTEAIRSKFAQVVFKELQLARQEALQQKKAERRKIIEETEAKLSAEVLRKKEEKDRARQMKKAMPKVKMSRAR